MPPNSVTEWYFAILSLRINPAIGVSGFYIRSGDLASVICSRYCQG